MLQLGDETSLFSLVFVVVLLVTRSPVWTTVLTASLYLFLAMFRFPQVPVNRARQVLHPVKGAVGSGKVSVVAHRGGGHDAPENTIAAVREVRGGGGEVWASAGVTCGAYWSGTYVLSSPITLVRVKLVLKTKEKIFTPPSCPLTVTNIQHIPAQPLVYNVSDYTENIV